MAWSVTLTEMLTELRARGGYRRSTSLTDAVLTPFLNTGIAEVHDLIVKHNPDVLVTSADIPTVAGTATIALPSTFYKSRRVDLVEGSVSTRLRSFEIDEETYLGESTVWDSAERSSRPRYMLQAGTIRFSPVPTSVQTIRLWFIPHATKLVSGGDVYTGYNGHEDLVYEHALRLCKARDRMSTADHDAAIARLTKRLLFALEGRDTSEPDYCPDLGRGSW
jgi:hypothetical protein